MKKPRGIRNNNPLNIRRSATRWQGAREKQTDKSFVQFESMTYGYRAAWRVLESYWKFFASHKRPFTVENIIRRWAPPKENHTDSYVKTVLRLTSLGGNERLPRPSMYVAIDKLVSLLAAMTTMECGTPYEQVDTGCISEAYLLAFPNKPEEPHKTEKQKRYERMPVTNPYRISTSSGSSTKMWDEYWNWSPDAKNED